MAFGSRSGARQAQVLATKVGTLNNRPSFEPLSALVAPRLEGRTAKDADVERRELFPIGSDEIRVNVTCCHLPLQNCARKRGSFSKSSLMFGMP